MLLCISFHFGYVGKCWPPGLWDLAHFLYIALIYGSFISLSIYDFIMFKNEVKDGIGWNGCMRGDKVGGYDFIIIGDTTYAIELMFI